MTMASLRMLIVGVVSLEEFPHDRRAGRTRGREFERRLHRGRDVLRESELHLAALMAAESAGLQHDRPDA